MLSASISCLALTSALLLSSPECDLETQTHNCVLETKRIRVPGYPHAFNPAIVRWRGQLLMSFRVIPDPKNSFNTEVGVVALNDRLQPLGKPQLLYLRDEMTKVPCRAEDIRFLTLGERLFIIYDDNEEPKISKGGFRMYIAELMHDGDHFLIGDSECLRHFEGESKEVREKSWVPFVYKGRILLAYSLNPHKILEPRLDGSGICDTLCTTQADIPWGFGELRGGTQAQLEGGHYLSFFHSSIEMKTLHSQGESITHYFMGAYTFSSEPPFVITGATLEPIIGKNFYRGTTYKPYWKPIRCVFPCGYISEGNSIWIAYGRDDHECWIAKLDRSKLLARLSGSICEEKVIN